MNEWYKWMNERINKWIHESKSKLPLFVSLPVHFASVWESDQVTSFHYVTAPTLVSPSPALHLRAKKNSVFKIVVFKIRKANWFQYGHRLLYYLLFQTSLKLINSYNSGTTNGNETRIHGSHWKSPLCQLFNMYFTDCSVNTNQGSAKIHQQTSQKAQNLWNSWTK